MNKKFLALSLVVAAIFGLQAFTSINEPEWKNLHILPKDISEDGLDSVMHHFTRSLNVKCNYCHVWNGETRKMDFANDAKPEKLIARKMMEMTIDINKNHFVQIEESLDSAFQKPSDTASVQYMLKYVTCYTCHHGNQRPENQPPKKQEPAKM